MAEIPEVPPLEGIKDVWGLIGLIRDEAKYTARLKALETVRNAINKNLKAVGTVREIDKLRVQMQTDRTNAASELTTARTKAAGIVQSAKGRKGALDRRVSELDEREAAIDKTERVRRKAAETVDAALVKRAADLDARETTIAASEEAVRKAAEDAVAAKGRLDVAVAEIGRAVDGARA